MQEFHFLGLILIYQDILINTLNFICKDSDNYGIIVIFAPRISIVYQVSQQKDD
jgi:hypothetical protein